MSKFLSNELTSLEPYVPGEQPQDFKYIKLNTNESPFPPSPKVVASLDPDIINSLRLYSDPECKDCRSSIANKYSVDADNVLLGNGSDEILNFVFRAFCDKEIPVAFPDISYGFYEVFADLYGLHKNIIRVKEDLSIDFRDYLNIGCTIVIANPNAPTGLALNLEEIEAIVRSNPDNIVCIDEAYVDFGADSAVSLIKTYDNLIVVQTFSKSRQLAGARLGMAFASKEIINDLNTIRYSTNPYNINSLTLIAGKAAVEDSEYFAKTTAEIINIREHTKDELIKRGFIVTDSITNFLFVTHPDFSGKTLYTSLKKKGILVRHFEKPRIDDYLRVTVGKTEEMDAFLNAIDEILSEK